jgi:hypothetical protein
MTVDGSNERPTVAGPEGSFEARSHGFALPVYASWPASPLDARNTRYRLARYALPGRSISCWGTSQGFGLLHASSLSVFIWRNPIHKSPEGSMGSRHRAVSDGEAGALRACPTERAARAGHGPSPGHRPGSVLPWLVRGIARAVAYPRVASPRTRPGPRSSMTTSSSSHDGSVPRIEPVPAAATQVLRPTTRGEDVARGESRSLVALRGHARR